MHCHSESAVLYLTYRSNNSLPTYRNSKEMVTTYIYSKNTAEGPGCTAAGAMRQPYSSLPLLLFRGVLVCLDASGKVVQMRLESHTHDSTLEGLQEGELVARMRQNWRLRRFEEAYIYGTRIADRAELLEFARAALFHLEIDYAVRVYRLAGAADMVFALNAIRHVEERNLVCGHVLVLLAKFDEAQVSLT